MENDTFEMNTGQAHEVAMAFKRTGWNKAEVKTLTGGDMLAQVREFVLGRAEFVMKPVEPVAPPEPISPTIRVDRSVKPSYPDWTKKVMHPELESTGPAEFDISKLELWLHEDQKGGWVKGKTIYECLKKKEMLEGCLGLTDLEAIKAKGLASFRQHFSGKAVFGWKSVVRNAGGNLNVPYAIGLVDEVVVSWYWLVHVWSASNPALRFASSPGSSAT